MKSPISRLAPPLILLIALTASMQVLVDAAVVPSFLVPSPRQVADVFMSDGEALGNATLQTLAASLEGLLLSLVVGVGLAFLFSLQQQIRRAVYPFMIFFQTVPIVAIAPLLVIWFGFGFPTVRAAALIVSLFPLLANTMAGLDMATRENRELFQALGSSPLQTLRKLSIPSALPAFFAGLRVSAGLAVVGAIVGEFIAGGGLGSLIDSGRTQQRVDFVFAAILLSSLVGLALVTLVDILRVLVFRYRPFAD